MDILKNKKQLSKEEFVLHMKEIKKDIPFEKTHDKSESKIKEKNKTKLKFRW